MRLMMLQKTLTPSTGIITTNDDKSNINIYACIYIVKRKCLNKHSCIWITTSDNHKLNVLSDVFESVWTNIVIWRLLLLLIARS